jgi:small conductance mechanosensitive channel
MKIRKLLPILLLVTLSSATLAQTAGEAEPSDLQKRLGALSSGAAALVAMDKRIADAPEGDREVLLFRRDERSFGLLLDLDKVVRLVAELPADDPARLEVEKRLKESLQGAGDAVFRLLDDVDRRITTYNEQLESLSGTRLIATQSYISSLEQLRIRYYEGVVDIMEGRKLLEIQVDSGTRERLENALYLQAEKLAGYLEFSGQALEQVEVRLKEDPANADLDATMKNMGSKHSMNLQRLKAIVRLMERLDLDDAAYKSVLLQQGDSFSLRTLESGVVMGLLRDGLASLRAAAVANGPDILFRLLVFVLILLVFRVLSRLTRRAVSAACDRPGVNMSTLLKDVLQSICGGTVMAIGFLMALSQIGISLGPMLAGLGVAGFVVGFALQDTLGNFAAGGMILIYRPYDVDDFVEVTGASGLVKNMSLVSTTITTFDNQTLVIPNSKIWGDVIKNVTAQRLRRVDLEFGIGYGDDVELAERVLNDIVSSHDMVLPKPETMIKLHTLGDSSVNFIVRPWVKTEDYWNVYWDITREVKLRFDREGISIPFPQRDVHLYSEQA